MDSLSEANKIFEPFWPQGKKTALPKDEAVLVQVVDDPIEQIEFGINRITKDVGEHLLTRLRDSHPDFFEEAVVKLLLAMGYGGAEQRGRRIGGTGDGGVDGVIEQDALGLERIYVQAKRYKEGNSVGRETIQHSSVHCTDLARAAESSSPPAHLPSTLVTTHPGSSRGSS